MRRSLRSQQQGGESQEYGEESGWQGTVSINNQRSAADFVSGRFAELAFWPPPGGRSLAFAFLWKPPA